jgi:uncharacterized protein
MIELVALPQQLKFGQDKRDKLPRYCLECDVRFACHGECPKNRFVETPDGEPGVNYLCAGFKTFFHHVDFPMKLLVGLLRRGHEARDVMAVLERVFAGVQRNDPCPCGSGQKFKRCHGAAPERPAGKNLPVSVARSAIPANPASVTPPGGSNA